MKVASKYLYISRMSSNAQSTVRAAVAHAEQNKNTSVHEMSLAEFTNLVNLPRETTTTQIISIMTETRRAIMAVRVIEYSASGKKDLLNSNWPIFLFVTVTNSDVSFEVAHISGQISINSMPVDA